jgi:predicted DNA-binding transcriptional regulator YafY
MKALKKIQQALKENRLLSFEYCDRKGQASIRRIEPYSLILKKMSWYLGGYCLIRQALRLFKVARMIGPELIEETFEPRAVDTSSFITRNFDDAECVPGLIRVSARARETILELFGDSALTQESPSTWLARIPLSDSEQGYSFIAGLGCDSEVLKPAYFRERMQKHLQKALSVYS